MDTKIYILWDMNADSRSGKRTLMSIHGSLEGARERLKSEYPNIFMSDALHAEPYDNYVKNYTYFTIEERELLP